MAGNGHDNAMSIAAASDLFWKGLGFKRVLEYVGVIKVLKSPQSEVMAYHSRGGNLNVALKTLSLSAFSQAASWQKALALSASERIDVVLLNALVTCCARVAR